MRQNPKAYIWQDPLLSFAILWTHLPICFNFPCLEFPYPLVQVMPKLWPPVFQNHSIATQSYLFINELSVDISNYNDRIETLQQTVLSAWLLYVKSWQQSAPVSTTSPPPNTIFCIVTIFIHWFILLSKPCEYSGFYFKGILICL